LPTNLPPDFFNAEKRFRLAKSAAEKAACLEEMLSLIPKHKGTDHLRADYRRQLSKLKSSTQTPKKTSVQISAFRVEREGAAQVAVVGATNTGKSSLVAALTNAEPAISEAPYTTWRPMPGMMDLDGAQIQLIDTPPLDREYLEPELIDLIRRVDLILLVVDLQADPVEQLAASLATLADNQILTAYQSDDEPVERLAPSLPVLVLANKCDDESLDELCEIFREMMGEDRPVLAVSALTGRNFTQLKEAVFQRLDLVRIYSKTPGEEPDLEAPFVLKYGATVEELAGRVHKDFQEQLKFAKVWGSTAFDGQMVQRDYVLQDGDIIELHI
jgi:uncharacterized protein